MGLQSIESLIIVMALIPAIWAPKEGPFERSNLGAERVSCVWAWPVRVRPRCSARGSQAWAPHHFEQVLGLRVGLGVQELKPPRYTLSPTAGPEPHTALNQDNAPGFTTLVLALSTPRWERKDPGLLRV